MARRSSGAGWQRCTAPAHHRSGTSAAPSTDSRCESDRSSCRTDRSRAGWSCTPSTGCAALARRAAERGALPDGTQATIDRVCERLPELAGPPEPPARLHGDLWSGNVLADATGRPHLIDPAAHGGHREVDLAMLRLFGGPGERCFAAYAEAAPLADGHAERVALWQLFPLLVHAVLFGGGYGSSVARIARRYS